MKMNQCLIALMGMALCVVVGCQKDNPTAGSSPMNASTDVCTHCAGDQKATADGKCPVCQMPVAATATMDACTHCDGMQMATSEGKCPVCNAPAAKPNQ